jgi:hypothetical protein
MKKSRIHLLYDMAFAMWRVKAKQLGVTLKAIAQDKGYSGKVLRRGTPGAFGFDLRPRQHRERVGLWGRSTEFRTKVPGNARQRRFARRHPQHSVVA